MLAAYVSASALRGVVTSLLIVGVGLLFTSVAVANPLYLAAFLLVITVLFGGLGVIGGLWADDFDYPTVMNQFILRPLVFFGAVFYSLDILPPFWRNVSLYNPMVYTVSGVRYGIIGVTEIDPNASLGVLTGATIAVLLIDLLVFNRGYGLTD
jgi:ABC-2 type transport system permease protein